jgi:hypothetical protein
MLNGNLGHNTFAVRSLIRIDEVYEERITMWRAQSAEEAIQHSEESGRQYAEHLGGIYVDFAQVYQLADDPTLQGAEVFSLLRSSSLPPGEYLSRFFDTGSECQRPIQDTNS